MLKSPVSCGKIVREGGSCCCGLTAALLVWAMLLKRVYRATAIILSLAGICIKNTRGEDVSQP